MRIYPRKRIPSAALAIMSILVAGGLATPARAVDSATIIKSSRFTAQISGIGPVWSGDIPSDVALPTSGYSATVDFQVQGLLPIATLTDKALGVTVEFELWSTDGRKVASADINSWDWNPTGPNTMVSMRIPLERASGSHQLLIHTMYRTQTTGLLSNYRDQEVTRPFAITGGTSVAEPTPTITSSEASTATISGVGNIWSASIPTAITLPANEYSSYLTFPITAILPRSTLRDRALGVDVEFRIRDSSGKDVASTTLYSRLWNPTSDITLVRIYLGSNVTSGNFSLVARTIYSTSTTGLLSRYLEHEITKSLTISGKSPSTTTNTAPFATKTVTYTASISGVGAVWTGAMPTAITIPANARSSYLPLSIKGLLPVATLTDRALGVDVEFELWSEAGDRVGYENVYSSSWNAQGGDTAGEISLSRASQGNYKLYIFTTYATRTNGMLTSYLHDQVTIDVTITGGTTSTIDRGRTESAASFTAAINGVGSIWTGRIPTKVALSEDGYSSSIIFPIQGLLPHNVLADKALGVSIEFEVWSPDGLRLGRETVYSFDWNPTGPQTQVSISLLNEPTAGTHTLVMRTMYETDSDGVLSGYLEQEATQDIEFTGGPQIDEPGHTVISSTPVTASIAGIGDVWRGEVPTVIGLGTSSGGLRFGVQGLLAKPVLRDKALGVRIEFELWSQGGAKVAWDDLSPYEWNPVGATTIEELYLSTSDVAPGTYKLLARTVYATRTTGYLTSYLKTETIIQVEFKRRAVLDFGYLPDRNLSEKTAAISSTTVRTNNSAVPVTIASVTPTICSVVGTVITFLAKGTCTLEARQADGNGYVAAAPARGSFAIYSLPPAAISSLAAKLVGLQLNFTFTVPASDEPITGYEVGIAHTTSATADPQLKASYVSPTVLKPASAGSFEVTLTEIQEYLNSRSPVISGAAIRIVVRAHSAAGVGDWSNGIYATATQLAQAAAPTPTPTATATPSSTSKPVPAKRTIKCVKGKVVRQVTAVNPKCPAGYTRRK